MKNTKGHGIIITHLNTTNTDKDTTNMKNKNNTITNK